MIWPSGMRTRWVIWVDEDPLNDSKINVRRGGESTAAVAFSKYLPERIQGVYFPFENKPSSREG